MPIVVADEPGKVERRAATRVQAEFKVEFHEINEAEADRMIRELEMVELELPEGAEDLRHIPESVPTSSSRVPLAATNVSRTGVKVSGDFHLLSDRPLERGTRLAVHLYMPLKPFPVTLLAAVAWVWAGDAKADMGLCFTAAKLEDLAKIDSFVDGRPAV